MTARVKRQAKEVARIDHEVIADGVAERGAGTGLPIMKLLTLRDRVEAACPPCHLGLPTPCGTSSPRCCRRDRPMSPPIRGAATAAGSRDRIVFDKLIQVLRFGCSYEAIADTTCSATTMRDRRDEWIALGVFAAAGPDRPRGLRPHRRAGARRDRRRRVHHQGPRRRRGRRPVPGRPAQTGHETVGAGRGLRHPAGPGPGRGAPPRLAAAGPHPGPARRSRPAARGDHRASGRRLRLGQDPQTSPSAGCAARSRTRARRRRSRPANAGTSSGPTPGTTRSTGSNAATNAARR